MKTDNLSTEDAWPRLAERDFAAQLTKRIGRRPVLYYFRRPWRHMPEALWGHAFWDRRIFIVGFVDESAGVFHSYNLHLGFAVVNFGWWGHGIPWGFYLWRLYNDKP